MSDDGVFVCCFPLRCLAYVWFDKGMVDLVKEHKAWRKAWLGVLCRYGELEPEDASSVQVV